jgi:hypothetical protein
MWKVVWKVPGGKYASDAHYKAGYLNGTVQERRRQQPRDQDRHATDQHHKHAQASHYLTDGRDPSRENPT